MISEEKFWKEETTAPLLARNGSCLNPTRAPAAVERAALWGSYIPNLDDSLDRTQLSETEKLWLTASRIAKADVVRLFSTKHMQSRLLHALTLLENRLGSYSQGMAFVVAFMLLFLPDARAIAIALRLATDERYLRGFWHHEPIAFATDAYVFDHLVSVHLPEVHTRLSNACLFPETYCQKWFVGLCVHVLPFSALLDFFDAFLKHGKIFLYQFGISLTRALQKELLAATGPADLYAILRFDPNFKAHRTLDAAFAREIVNGALTEDLKIYDLTGLRTQLYEKKLKSRMETFNRKRQPESDDSDHSGGASDESDSEEEEEGLECNMCEEMVPDFFCGDCNKYICEACNVKRRGTHSKDHNPVTIEEHRKELLHRRRTSSFRA